MLLDQQMSDTQASQEQRRGQADQGPAHDEYRHPVFDGGIHCVLQLQGRLRQMEHECPAEDLFDHGSPAWLTDLAPPVGPGHDRIRDAPRTTGQGAPTIRLSHPDRTGTDDAPLGPSGPEGDA
ncbi:hypothetical protein Scani_44030 [Streptomyces caniferus]|uniref:Uncharacterized protein n=1 Tax=Streptomyces caniferus TaxID=285557 RepID=A0A640SEY3_9ACTN|nr:hypothetical protein Scani_44030 [Streptomyces caniferus]